MTEHRSRSPITTSAAITSRVGGRRTGGGIGTLPSGLTFRTSVARESSEEGSCSKDNPNRRREIPARLTKGESWRPISFVLAACTTDRLAASAWPAYASL